MRVSLLIAVVFVIFTTAIVADAQRYIRRDLSKLQVGMTTDEVRSLFGRPDHINKYGTPKGEEQQWVYREGRNQDLYIYFENGVYNGYYQRTGEKHRAP